jgi:hypothetical protein
VSNYRKAPGKSNVQRGKSRHKNFFAQGFMELTEVFCLITMSAVVNGSLRFRNKRLVLAYYRQRFVMMNLSVRS